VDDDLERAIRTHLDSGELAPAATAAIDRLGPQIFGYLAATLRDDDAAYDVYSQFCEELWKSISTFRGESSFKTWAYKLVMHAVGRYRRDGYRKRAMPLGSGDEPAAQERSSTPPYQKSEVKDKFAELRESLDPEDQTLLFLRVDQKLAWADVAAVIAAEGGEPIEVATLRKRFERAKLRLRELAAAAGLLE
jgi:RNA polymerase sigma-70 factor (ECF subfamily)